MRWTDLHVSLKNSFLVKASSVNPFLLEKTQSFMQFPDTTSGQLCTDLYVFGDGDEPRTIAPPDHLRQYTE